MYRLIALSRHLARRAFALAAVIALMLVMAGCGSSNGVATVDGEPISFEEVAAVVPQEGDTVDSELFARSLMLIISERVLMAEAERQFGLVFTDADVEAKVDELVLQTGLSVEEILANYNLTEAALRNIGAQQLVAEEVTEQLAAADPGLTEEEMAERYEAMLPSLAEVCAAHILLESEEEALTALNRARAGEDFGMLAMELSIGPSGPNGGSLGCAAPASYVAEFADATLAAELGTAYGPVQTQFGWHVILVSDRAVPSLEEARGQISADTEGLWINWLVDALAAADVVVEPEYGTWTTTPEPNVIPPTG